jgi:signal transduction histidine kinase
MNFGFFTGPLVFIVLLALFHLVTGRMLLRNQIRREKLELREKLSRDLHDDLASTLGSISIYAGTLNRKMASSPSDDVKLSQKISNLTQSALQSISEIIWMTSPRNDTLQSLISKTTNYMMEMLTDNQISFYPEISIPEEQIILDEKIRNNTFLILKEALNNTIRHSGADSVWFSAGLSDNLCRITLKDNGKGFNENERSGKEGNGLINMRTRAVESGISYCLLSSVFCLLPSEKTGVEIILEFKI